MKKQVPLSMTLRKTTTQEIVETNFYKYLDETEELYEIKQILQFMRNNLIRQDRACWFISIDEYINFFKMIPSKLWSNRPIFYFRKGKFDGLGLLGERIHEYNILSKTLQLYFDDGLGIRLIDVLDNKEESFNTISCQKDRLIDALTYLKLNVDENQLRKIYVKSRKICDGRYY